MFQWNGVITVEDDAQTMNIDARSCVIGLAIMASRLAAYEVKCAHAGIFFEILDGWNRDISV